MLKVLSITTLRRLGILLSFTLVLVACSKVPLTGRRQFNLVPESEVVALSLTQYQQFLSQNQVVTNTSDATRVKTIGSRLATAVEAYLQETGNGDRIAGYQWEFNLVQNEEPNAWCLPGGKIVFYTGIIPLCQSDAGIATVMGHEIAHAVARHGNERMSQGLAAELGGQALSVALSTKPQQTQQLFNLSYGLATNLGVLLPYSRKHESEADRLGLLFMAKAGYDPQEAVTFWQRMAAANGASSTPEFLSTHPSNEKRIAQIQKYLPDAQAVYKPQ